MTDKALLQSVHIHKHNDVDIDSVVTNLPVWRVDGVSPFACNLLDLVTCLPFLPYLTDKLEMGKINNQQRISWKNCIFLRIHLLKIGSFSIDDGDGSENATFKMDHRISNFVAFIPIRWKCLMWANFPGVDFLGTAFKFKKRKKISSSFVYVPYRTWN